MSNINKLDNKYSITDLENNIAFEQEEFRKKISKIKDGEEKFKSEKLVYLNNEILKIINNIDARINYWEGRRTQFLQIALGLIGASFAGIISILPEIQNNYTNISRFNTNFFYCPLFFSLLVLILGGIQIILQWNIQNNPNYPFTKSFRVWRWQYRYAELEGNQINVNLKKGDEDGFLNEAKKFQSNLMNYKNKTIMSDIDELVDQNVSQLYLLITNEKYKIKYVTKLRDILMKYLTASLWVFIGIFFINIIFTLL
jgi:hypothetical protein